MTDKELLEIAKYFIEIKDTCMSWNYMDIDIEEEIKNNREKVISDIKNEFTYLLGICGCGNPELVLEGIYNLLILIRDKSSVTNNGLSEEETNKAEEKYKELIGIGDNRKVNWTYLAVLYLLDDKEFTEHGTGIYGCWIDTLGKYYLKIFSDKQFIYKKFL